MRTRSDAIIAMLLKKKLRQTTAGPSYARSTFTTNDWDFTADNIDDATDTLTVYDSNGVVMSGVDIVFTSEDTLINAGTCTLATDAAEIETTTGTANITAYVLNAAGTPLPGIPAAVLSLASTGTGNTITAIDTVTDRNGRFRWTFSSTVAEAKTLTLTAIGIVVTDTAAVTVMDASGLLVPAFRSQFAAARGSGVTAVQDGGLWDGNYTNNGGAEVVAAPVAGFPTPLNVLRHTPQIGTAGAFIIETDTISVPSVGSTRYYRWYFKKAWQYTGDSDADNTHPIQDGPGGIGGTSWVWTCGVQSDDTWLQGFQVQSANGENSFANQKWHSMTMLDPEVVYRFEVAIVILSSTSFNIHVQVYDESNVLVLDDTDYGRTNSGNDQTLADDPTLFFRNAGSGVDGVNTLGYFKCGCNGIIDSVVATQHYADQTGFAICDDQGWIGPYGTVQDETPILLHETVWPTTGATAALLRSDAEETPWELLVTPSSTALSIVDAASEGVDTGCPTPNCMRVDLVYNGNPVQNMDTQEVSNLPGGGAWPIPGVGASLYFCIYKYLVYPNAADPPALGNNNHCIEQASGGGNDWSWSFNTAAGGWQPSFNLWNSGAATRYSLGGPSVPVYLNRDAWYRLEWRVYRTGATTCEFEIRIYDASGTLVYDTDDMMTTGSVPLTGVSKTITDVARWDGWQIGTNGPHVVGATQGAAPAWYFAAPRVSAQRWIGAYQ